MNWKDIEVSEKNNSFTFKDALLYDKVYVEVLKFHSPGIAPVKDKTGWYHIDIIGNQIYKERYDRVFGYYFNSASVILKKNWFHINEKGLRFYNENYAWTGNYQEHVCTVRDFNNQYFHIDFGHFLGNFKYAAGGIRRERTSFVFTKEMSYAMKNGQGGADLFERFVDTCAEALKLLHENGSALVNMFI